MTREVEELCAALDGLRAGFLKKVAGLSDDDARRSAVGSGTNLAGLLQHLTFVESGWFEENVGGGKARGNRSMQVDRSASLESLRADYRAACQTSNEIVAAIGDTHAPMNRKTKARRRQQDKPVPHLRHHRPRFVPRARQPSCLALRRVP